MNPRILLAACAASLIALTSSHAEWAMKKGPLMTRWAEKVDPAAPLPEYPRPQLVRPDWQNLNGIWEYQPGAEGDAPPFGKKLSSEILVPFCVESAISGVMEHHERLWYRRDFSVPRAWTGKQVILHFGAVDYESEVFLNGKSLGVHKGGYIPFSYDITQYLKPEGSQELIVRVFDPTIKGGQPRGKQTTNPGGIMYTPTTGIWQTVWLEPVSKGAVKDIKIVPDIDAGNVKVTVNTYDAAAGDSVSLTAVADKLKLESVTGPANTEITIPIPDAKLWSPDSPFLYDLKVEVSRSGKVVDEVDSYFGMRKIELAEVDGVKKLVLNNKFFFQIGPLDQGYWPDGIYTAPTEEALKYDIEMTKKLGFNMIRKHIKVEPMRWYYWTDKLGLMVWQDMPSANSYTPNTPPVDKEEYESELTQMIHHLYSVPSIIQWEIFNEGQGSHDQPRLVALVRKLDPTRTINEDSGGPQTQSGDVHDIHPYPPPQCPPPSATQALAVGEYGGIGMDVPGHMWHKPEGGYTKIQTPEELVDLYAEFTAMLKNFRDNNGLSAAVYTQITDVETEVNGLLTYDRIPKMSVEDIALANHFAYPAPTYTVVVPTSEKESQTWQYTFDKPADDWMKPAFDASAWKTGKGGFGTKGTPNIGILGTVWDGSNIWLRREFNPGNLTEDQLSQLVFRIFNDEDVDVYINGVLAYHHDGYTTRYVSKKLLPEGLKAIKSGASNVLAVRCHQTVAGQYIDVGLSLRTPGK
jgi:hypothetical protein